MIVQIVFCANIFFCTVEQLFVVGTSGGVQSKDFGVRIAVAAGALAWQEPVAAESQHSIIVGQTKSVDLICVSNYPLDIVVSCSPPSTSSSTFLSLESRSLESRKPPVKDKNETLPKMHI